jgi:hypothetical protein
MWRWVCLKARASTVRKRAVIIGNLHITRMEIVPLADSQNQIVWERLPLAAKSGLTEINCCRCRGTTRGEGDRQDLRVLPVIQARRGHTNDLPLAIITFKSEDLAHEGVVMCPPPITHCQRFRARNPLEKWRIRTQTTSRPQFRENGQLQRLWGVLRGKTLE